MISRFATELPGSIFCSSRPGLSGIGPALMELHIVVGVLIAVGFWAITSIFVMAQFCRARKREAGGKEIDFEASFEEVRLDHEICCGICLENAPSGTALVALKCNHAFHDECIRAWFVRGSVKERACPFCRDRHHTSFSLPIA